MKHQFLGIFFYMIYLLAMIQPLIPIIDYYANYDYIASALCENRDKPYMACNGKCYLEKQLEKTNHDSHDHKSNIPQIDFEKYPISPLDAFSYTIIGEEELHIAVISAVHQFKQEYEWAILQPPQV